MAVEKAMDGRVAKSCALPRVHPTASFTAFTAFARTASLAGLAAYGRLDVATDGRDGHGRGVVARQSRDAVQRLTRSGSSPVAQ
jgi:hypothetical protein